MSSTSGGGGGGGGCCQFQQMVAQFFRDESRLVARWPLPFLVAPLLLTAALSAAVFVYPERLEEKPSENRLAMFLPEGVSAMQHLAELKRLFPPKDVIRESYDVFKNAYAYVIVEDATPRKNILRDSVLRIANDLNRRIMKLEVSLGWLRANFTQICHRQGGECLIHPIIILLNSTDPLPSMEFFLRYPSLRIGNQTIYNSPIFGSVTLNNESFIKSAGAIRLPYLLADAETSATEVKLLGYLWQKEFLKLIRTLHYPGVNIYYSTAISWAEEIDRNGQLILPYIPALFAVLIVFTVCSCFTSDWVQSKPWLGLCGILNGCFAVASTMGALVLLEYPFLQMVFIMPFLILSISVDNMFIMMSSWRNTDRKDSVENRMSTAIGETAVSIMITALTDGLSFSVGSISQFPAVRIFCTYCALAVLLVFVYQMSFFIACMALSGRREAANRHALTFRPAIPRSAAGHKSLFYRLLCTGGNEGLKGGAGGGVAKKEIIAHFLSTSYADAIDNWGVKVVVLITYCAYIAGAVYGVIQLPLGLDLPMLVPSDSYTALEFAATERHFTDYGGYAYAVIQNHDGQLPIYKKAVLESMLRLHSKLSRTAHTTTGGQFWLRPFYLASHQAGFSSNAAFIRALKVFLAIPANKMYINDVYFAPDNSQLVASTKMLIQTRHSGFANHTTMAALLRGIFADSGLPGFVYDPTFVLVDQQERTLVTTLQNVGIAVGVMLGIAFLFIPKLVSALWIGVSILSINMGVIGGLALWGVHLDIVSMITIVMSIGFSVDFVAHITFHFLVARPPKRVHQALAYVGLPILQSALSTVLGVSTLIPAGSYMVRAFVKTVALVVGLGTLHGLLFLPVILSIFVPADTYLQSLQIYSNKVGHYLASNIPKYISGIGNKRMRAYHAPHTLGNQPGTSVETMSLPDSDISVPRAAAPRASALDHKDLHEPNLRRSSGRERRSVALPPPPPPPDRSLHSRRSLQVASLRHASSVAQRLQEKSRESQRRSTRRQRDSRRGRPGSQSQSMNDIYDFLRHKAEDDDDRTASDYDHYSEVWDDTYGECGDASGSWDDHEDYEHPRISQSSSHSQSHRHRQSHSRSRKRPPLPPPRRPGDSTDVGSVSTTESSEAPLVRSRRRPPPAIYVPSPAFPPPHSARRRRDESPRLEPGALRHSARLYLKRGQDDEPRASRIDHDQNWGRTKSSRRRPTHVREDFLRRPRGSHRPSRGSEYIPPPPRETQDFFLRAPSTGDRFSRSVSSPDLGDSDGPTPQGHTVQIVLNPANRSIRRTASQDKDIGKSHESLLSDAFTAFRPSNLGNDGTSSKMRPAFGASSVPDFSTFKGRCEGRTGLDVLGADLDEYVGEVDESRLQSQMMY